MDKKSMHELEEHITLKRHANLVMVQNTPKGRGIFASSNIPAHTTLDVCPVLVLDPVENATHIAKTRLFFYTYNWPSSKSSSSSSSDAKPTGSSATSTSTSTVQPCHSTQALPLGLGSLFNHSRCHQNVGWTRDLEKETITFVSLRDIAEGEELCVSYGATERLGFRDADDDANSVDMVNGHAGDAEDLLRIWTSRGEFE